MQKGWQRTTLNSLEDNEQELWKYIINHKRNDCGIKQRLNFHTHKIFQVSTNKGIFLMWMLVLNGKIHGITKYYEYWWNVK
jgi:hypothetical protein